MAAPGSWSPRGRRTTTSWFAQHDIVVGHAAVRVGDLSVVNDDPDGEVADLVGDVRDSAGEVRNHAVDMRVHEGEVDDLAGDMRILDGEVDDLEADVRDADGKGRNHAVDVRDLDSEVDDLAIRHARPRRRGRSCTASAPEDRRTQRLLRANG